MVEPKNATEIPEKTNVTEETIENIVLPEKVRYALLGKPSNRIFGKIWDFGPTEGGGLPIPNFYPIFPEQT